MGKRREAGRLSLTRAAAFFLSGFVLGLTAALLSPVRADRGTR